MNKLSLFIPEIAGVQKSGHIRVAGIDLGTTNSTVSEILWSHEQSGTIKARSLELAQRSADGQWVRSTLVPSEVAIHNDEVYIGEGARQLRSRSLACGLQRDRDLFYECKNDIGIRKTYDQAPDGFRSAAEISGKVLGFLYNAVTTESPVRISRTVVTVPSSFQVAQRRDTLEAARLAGLDLADGDLLDEPLAAFLDYLILHREEFSRRLEKPQTLLVFDFGGGTCDVALFSVSLPLMSAPVKVSPLAISRYHRLGGGDIDRAIVHEVLLPQIISVKELAKFDFTFDDKKEYLEPALLGIAEELKIQLCNDLARLEAAGPLTPERRAKLASAKPGIFTFDVRGTKMVLNCPRLTIQEFDKQLAPFLDEDLLYARETEYRLVSSVFAPLQDALDRSRLDRSAIDCCLLLGGSSRIPQVAEAVRKFLPRAAVLNYGDPAALQTAIARGAAFHGLTLELYGRGLVQPVCYDSIALRTETGTVELVPRGAELPYPGGKAFKIIPALAVPKSSLTEPLELKVEIVAGDEKRCLYRAVWHIPAPVNKGEPLSIKFRYDENQVLDISLLLEDSGERFRATLENPLINVVNPQKTMLRVLELEEQLRNHGLAGGDAASLMLQLGENYSELGHKEKAIAILKKALNAKGTSDSFILNRLGIYCKDIGDLVRAEKFYREAIQASDWTGPLFNLAMMQRRNGRHREAIATIDQAIAREDDGDNFVLRALLAADTGSQEDHAANIARAFKAFGPPESLSDWQLGWYLTGAEELKDTEKIGAAKAEQKRRSEKIAPDLCPHALLPVCRQGMQLKMQF